MLLLGAGPRAVLLQVAHPLVAEGVDRFSSFRTDPRARLAGDAAELPADRLRHGDGRARAEIRRLNGLHRSAGPVLDPAAAATFRCVLRGPRPGALAGVHATLIDSTLVTVERWIGPLPAERRARFYGETLVVGRLFGIGEDVLPPDIAAFDAYVAGMLAPSGPVHPGAMSRDLAAAILHRRWRRSRCTDRSPTGWVRRRRASRAPVRRLPPSAVDWLLVPVDRPAAGEPA